MYYNLKTMKKIILALIMLLLFTNNNIYASFNKQDKLINSFKQKIETMDKYNLEYVDISLKKLKVNYRNSAKTLYILNKLENLLTAEISKKWIVSYTDYDFISDFSDYKNVLWFAENVFVWKVVKNTWTYNNYWDPETNYEVEVLYNIKWTLKWNIDTVLQGWYENWVVIVSEWTKLLEEWGIYLLVTMWDIHKISSHQNWSYLLGFENKLQNDIKTTIWEDKKVKDYREAYKESSLYNTINNYIDLTKEEKEKYEDFDSWFVVE